MAAPDGFGGGGGWTALRDVAWFVRLAAGAAVAVGLALLAGRLLL